MTRAVCRHCQMIIMRHVNQFGTVEWRSGTEMLSGYCPEFTQDTGRHEPEPEARPVMLTDRDIATIWRALSAQAGERALELADRFAAIHPNNERRVLP